MKKTLVSILLLLAMMLNVLALASCGGDGDGGATDTFLEPPKVEIPEGGYDPEAKVTVTFYHTMGENLSTVLDKYILRFNEIYPNITIDHDQVGGYDDVRETISTELAVGGGPNIAYCYPDHVALYRRANKVIALDDLIASQASDGKGGIIGMTDAEKNNFIDGYWEEGYQFDDGTKMYTLPFSKSTEVLYYNKTFFDEHNLTPPTTWDQLETLLATIKQIDPTCIPLGYDSESNWFITMCEQYGSGYTSATGEKFLFNNDTNKAFIKRFNTWFQNGWITTQEIYGAYTSGLFVAQGENVQKSYMSIGSSAGATHQRPVAGADGNYPFEVGITSIPQLSATSEPKVISQGPSICVFDKGNDQQTIAAWLFVKYLTTSVEFQADFSIASGYVPVLESVMDIPAYDEFINGAKGYSNFTVNKQGKVISDFTRLADLAENALSVYTYDETAGTLSITVGETTAVLNVEKTEGADTVKLYFAEGDAKQYLTGAVDKGEYVFSANADEAGAFHLEACEGGYRFYKITGGADGGAYIAALSAKVCLEQAEAYYTSPAFVGSSAARDEVGVLLRKCISYKGSDLDAYIDKAFKDAINSCKYMAR